MSEQEDGANVKMVFMDPETARSPCLVVARYPDIRRVFDGSSLPEPVKVTQERLEISTVRLATQAIRVTYDPYNDVLHIGEHPDGYGGWVEETAERAVREGRDNPFLRVVNDAAFVRDVARMQRDQAVSQRERHARLVAEATERLKSRKSGVRRRAKRLLERLGR